MDHERIFEGLLDYWSAHSDEIESHWDDSRHLNIDDELFLAFRSEDFEGLGTVESIEMFDGEDYEQRFYITRIDKPLDGFSKYGSQFYYCGELKVEGESLKNIGFQLLKHTGVEIEGYQPVKIFE